MYREIARNRRRSAALLLAPLVVLGAAGYGVGLVLDQGQLGLGIGVALGAALALWARRYGPRRILSATGARPVSAQDEPRLHNVLEGLCLAAGIPKPGLYLIREESPNALATGTGQADWSIAVTRGLLEALNRVELEGALAHEVSHLRDRSAAPRTTAAAFALVLGPLSPILARALRPIWSRCEYRADAEATLLTRYPPGLAAALRKVAQHRSAGRRSKVATAHLWLVSPTLAGPAPEDRIRALEQM